MNSHFSQLDRSSASSSTSIKRSYEQFGLDHDNNAGGSTSRSAIDGSNRNKRARSEGRSSVEAESSSSSNSSSSSLETALTSPRDEDTSMEVANNSRSALSLNHPSPPTSSSSGPSMAISMEIPSPLGPQTEDIEMSTWPHATDEESFETALDRANDFERHIAVLRDLPPASPPPISNPPLTIPYINLLDYDSPPSSEVRSQPPYISWSSRLQQEQYPQDQSQPSHHHSSGAEELQSLSQDIATLRDSLGHHSPPLSHPTSRRPLSRGLRLPLPRFSGESGPVAGDRWSHDRVPSAESLSLRMLERDHSGIAALDRQSDVEYPGASHRRDNFPVDRGHLPSFSRHLEELRPDTIRRSSESDGLTGEWPRDETQLYPPLWSRSRRVDENPAVSEASRSSWYSTRPTPSNSLMSESAEHRRHRLQRQLLNNIATNDDEHSISRPTGPRARTERLLDVNRRPRSALIDDLSRPRSPMLYEQRDTELDGRRADALHFGSPGTAQQTSHWSSPLDLFRPYSAVHHSDGATPMDADDLEVLRQRRRDRMITAEALRRTTHMPPVGANPLSTHRSPSPTTDFHHLLDSIDGLSPRMAPDMIPPSPPVDITGRTSLLSSSRPAIFRSPSPSPPLAHHHLPPAFRSPPPNNNNDSLPSLPEELALSSPSIYRDMDLNAYQHGPFRSSLERFREIDRMRDSLRSRLNHLDSIVGNELSNRGERERPREREQGRERPPVSEQLQASLSRRERGRERDGPEYPSFTLPPLDFGTSRSGRGREVGWFDGVTRADPSTAMSVRPRSPAPISRRPTLSEVARQASQHRRRPVSVGGPRRSQSQFENPHFEHPNVLDNLELEDGRDRREMHEFLARRPRLEASRISDSIPSSHPPRPPLFVPDGQAQGFNQALDVLRGDGLSSHRQRQMIDRFNRDRSQESRRPSSLWGEMEQRDNDNTRRGLFNFRRTQVRRDVPAFNFGSTGTSTNSRGVGSGRTPTGRHRSASNSPTRGSGESPPNARSGRGNTTRRAGRHRFTNDFEGYFRYDHSRLDALDVPNRRYPWRPRNLGDYVRDEDFDDSFESLMNLTAALGEVKPRHTPDHVIGSLPSALYKDWATPGCDQRCPICLDDYQPTDQVLKISDCSHWLHKACLEQWLHSANTCPVCRKRVKGKRRRVQNGNNPREATSSGPPQPGPSGSRRADDDEDDRNNGNRVETNTSGRSASGSRLPWFFG